ncbi:unnamed protein product [Bursaphelenchus okinawaensis]|uniref:Transcription factor AP-2 C-terminal domain-containing protein n=1 Tax=Bursaphelenchus okinawaensis TaxID=465554 RepID=A0A811KZD7_9BILA|nr:unnamed protein product [Bursaphelenchus okinawaensis]CAG9114765.1 unnamed protein product [Bursaphelenchus okinawaensis]
MDNNGSADLKQLLMNGMSPQLQLAQLLQQQQQQQQQPMYNNNANPLMQILQSPMGCQLLKAMAQNGGQLGNLGQNLGDFGQNGSNGALGPNDYGKNGQTSSYQAPAFGQNAKFGQNSPRNIPARSKETKRKNVIKENQPPVDYNHLQTMNNIKQEAQNMFPDAQRFSPDAQTFAAAQTYQEANNNSIQNNQQAGSSSQPLGSLNVAIDQSIHQFQPLSSTTSIDEGVHTSSTSPADTRSGPVSPLDVGNDLELPKEGDQGDRKRPAAIMELLNNKKRRLELKKDNNETDGTQKENWSELFNRAGAREDDTETTSSSGSKHEVKSEDVRSSLEDGSLFRSLFGNQNSSEETEVKPEVFGSQALSTSFTNASMFELPKAREVAHDDIFSEVPGRLSLLSNVTKHKMTVAEVRRRVLGPECFNFSLLGALLRRAKMPEKSQALFDDLQKVGLSIPRGRRRNVTVSLMSALTEAEAEQLVHDFAKVSDDKFPIQEFVDHQFAQYCNNMDALKMRALELNITKKVVGEFIGLLQMDRSEIKDLKPEPVLPSNIQDPLSTYSMLTHGFGTPALQVGVNMLGTFVDRQMALLTAEVARIAKVHPHSH